ncbi:MAG: helix-turn-helix domain-containing protein [Betaproteobacteria bacterium]|nr:helix-turn-helix domain-containing protein [Betaproteobacteria bacterium]
MINESTKDFDSLPDGAHVPVRTAARILSVSTASIWRMARAGKLSAKKIGAKTTRFPVSEIRALLANS